MNADSRKRTQESNGRIVVSSVVFEKEHSANGNFEPEDLLQLRWDKVVLHYDIGKVVANDAEKCTFHPQGQLNIGEKNNISSKSEKEKVKINIKYNGQGEFVEYPNGNQGAPEFVYV